MVKKNQRWAADPSFFNEKNPHSGHAQETNSNPQVASKASEPHQGLKILLQPLKAWERQLSLVSKVAGQNR